MDNQDIKQEDIKDDDFNTVVNAFLEKLISSQIPMDQKTVDYINDSFWEFI